MIELKNLMAEVTLELLVYHDLLQGADDIQTHEDVVLPPPLNTPIDSPIFIHASTPTTSNPSQQPSIYEEGQQTFFSPITRSTSSSPLSQPLSPSWSRSNSPG